MGEQCRYPNFAASVSDEISFTMAIESYTLDSDQDSLPQPGLQPVKKSVQNPFHDSVLEPVQKAVQQLFHGSEPDFGKKGGKLAATGRRRPPFCPPIAALNQRPAPSREFSEDTMNSPSMCTNPQKSGEQDSVYCISKPAYQDDDDAPDVGEGIRPFSSCSQVKGADGEMEPAFPPNQSDTCERVEIEVDPELEQCSSSKLFCSAHSKFASSPRREVKKSPPARIERDSVKQSLFRVGTGVGMGVGVIPTVALAVPIMFGVSGTDPRLGVDPRLLAPSAENRRNHRLCSKIGQCNSQSNSQYTTRRFTRRRAKLSFVQNKKQLCSKRRLVVLISLLFLVGCCLALTAGFNTSLFNLASIESFFEDGAGRAEELSIDAGGQESIQRQLANWSPWTPWTECAPGMTERSRFRQCIVMLANETDTEVSEGAEQLLADAKLCWPLSLSQDQLLVGDIQVDNCSIDATPPQENILSVTVSFQGTLEYVVGQPTGPSKAAAARHCDECVGDEVCVALAREEVPECRLPLDSRDPTGCAGHCRLGVETCRKLDRDAFRCLEQQHCFDTEFRCANMLCIPGSKRCDGHNNCYDESDEYDCDCDLQTHFHCHNRTSCLALEKRCDGIIDCWDGSDEMNCTNACPGELVACTNGECVRQAYFCDGLRDCADGSDEPFGCGQVCHSHELTCANRRCVSAEARCDGQDDCGDGTDETSCSSKEPLSENSRKILALTLKPLMALEGH